MPRVALVFWTLFWSALTLAAAPCVAFSESTEADAGIPVQYESCAGWGLCLFRILPKETAAPNSAPPPSPGQRVKVRLRGVGDEALSGTCDPERDAARTVREFVEGILRRAGRITLQRPILHGGGVLLATVQADGTDVVDILVHIGHGRRGGMAPDARWCD